MNFQEVKSIIITYLKKYNLNFKKITKLIKKENPKVFEKVLEFTKFLPSNTLFNERCFCIINDIHSRIKCDCGNFAIFKGFARGYVNYCIDKNCIGRKRMRQKAVEKMKKTNLERFGTESPIRLKEFQEKREETCLKKYGVKNVAQVKEVKEKREKTNLEKYGTKCSLCNEEVRKKREKTWEEKYGVKHIFSKGWKLNEIKRTKLKNLYEKLRNPLIEVEIITPFENFKGTCNKYEWKCRKCGNIFVASYVNGVIPKCKNCHPPELQYISYKEDEIVKFLKKIDKSLIIERNTKSIIYPYELDLYFPQNNLAIEFNGLYWHSELNGKDKNYHLNKTNLCKEKGINLLHIFEDEWNNLNKQKIWKSIIKNKLGLIKYKIYARNCEIKEINSNLSNKFLDKYHLQGKDSSSIKLGAFYKNKLVAVMTFVKPRFNKKFDYELSRFCTLNNFSIVGIAGKLLKFFERNYNPKNLITYADLRYSNGDLYYKLEFKYSHQSKPNYFYFVKNKYRENRINYQKHKLKDKLEVFDKSLTEWENMQLNGYDRIWDCGNLVFIKEF